MFTPQVDVASSRGLRHTSESRATERESVFESWFPPLTQPMLMLALELLKAPRGPDRGLLLDLGAGDGSMAGHFQRIGYRVTCLEIEQTLLHGVRRRLPAVQGVAASAENLPFRANSFDAIYCNSVMQYVERARALTEVRRVLRPGGSLVVIENLHGSPMARMARAYLALRGRAYPRHLHPRRHLRRGELSLYHSTFRTVASRAFNLLTVGALACGKLPHTAIPTATAALRPLHTLDELCFRAAPVLEHLAWHLVIWARK